MKKELLNSIGINTKYDINVIDLFASNIDAEKYNLDKNSLEKIHILKEFIEEYNIEKPIDVRKQILCSQDAAKQMYDIFKTKEIEECWMLLLNASSKIIKRIKVSTGSTSSTIFDQKGIARDAIRNNASSVILFHNHPSGNPLPSKNDLKQTEKLTKTLKFFEINLMDHIIIGTDTYYSFAEEKINPISH